MEIQKGDIFKHGMILYKIISIPLDTCYIKCRALLAENGRDLNTCIEHKNTLLKMQKLSTLEKELI
jgi:hypothetical protein